MIRFVRLPATVVAACALAACNGQHSAPPAGRTTAGLKFTVAAPEGFGLVVDNGRTMSWTPGGRAVAPDEPRIVLTRSSQVYPADEAVRRQAPQRFLEGLTKDLTRVVVTGTDPITIDGMPGFETTARATSVRGGMPLMVYAASVFAGDGTFHMVAYDGGDDAQASLATFRDVARSLTVK